MQRFSLVLLPGVCPLPGRLAPGPDGRDPRPISRTRLIEAIVAAGGFGRSGSYALVPTGTELEVEGADALLFTSAMSYREARWQPRGGLLLIAIGMTTADAMRAGGHPPAVVGDGSLAGTLEALNRCVEGR